MGLMWNDLRYSVRMLRKNPGFTAVAVVTLALGIGANTAIFSLFDQVMLRLLPVENPRELVMLETPGSRPSGWSTADNNHTVHSYPVYLELRDRSEVFAGVIARTPAPVAFAHGGESERANGELVSGNFFEVLGVRPLLGRLFGEADDRADGAHPVVVLSHDFWERRFGGDTGIVGKTVRLNGHPMEVIGVAQPGFRGVMSGSAPELYMTLSMRRQMRPMLFQETDLDESRTHYLTVLARLKPGISREQAEAAMGPVFRGILEDEYAKTDSSQIRDKEDFVGRKMTITSALQGIHTLREQIEKPLISIMALAGLVLLIACANVASLLVARATVRGREIAIRLALGSGRWPVTRQLLVESVLLALLGGLAGLLVADWTMQGLAALGVGTESGDFTATLDGRLVLFNFGVAALTGLLFGLAPVAHALSSSVVSAIKDQSMGSGESRRSARLREAGVVVQVALSTLLLVAAGLFARSLHNLRELDPGFRTENLLSFSIDPQLSGYDTERGRRLYDDVLGGLRRLPGVRAAAAAEIPVLGGSTRGGNITVEGYEAAEDEYTGSSRNAVSPDFFRTMAIPIVLGRDFTEDDVAGKPTVVVVNEAFVQRYFRGENPLGRRMAFGSGNKLELDMEIVGVVKNQKSAELREEDNLLVYLPLAQMPNLPAVTYYMLTDREESALGPGVRRAVADLDTNLPVYDMQTIQVVVDEAVSLERSVATLAVSFAGVATLLAAVGLYGLMAFGVARRTREIGIRIALGAQRVSIVGNVLKNVAWHLGIGLALGIPAALGLGRLVESQLYGLRAWDPLVLAAAAVSLAVAGVLAAVGPARRAAKVDPVVALRYE